MDISKVVLKKVSQNVELNQPKIVPQLCTEENYQQLMEETYFEQVLLLILKFHFVIDIF